VKNVPRTVTGRAGEAYHGYWAQDIYSLNPHFGSPASLLALSSALHSRRMLLMVDVAPNHMGSGPAHNISYVEYIPWNHRHYFHPPKFGIAYSPPNQSQIEEYWIGDPRTVALPDVNTELREVSVTLYLWIRQIVEKYGVDGLRLDTVKHIRKSFWPGFCSAAGVFSLGEVYDGDIKFVTHGRN
jgi:alpha-amylase